MKTWLCALVIKPSNFQMTFDIVAGRRSNKIQKYLTCYFCMHLSKLT